MLRPRRFVAKQRSMLLRASLVAPLAAAAWTGVGKAQVFSAAQELRFAGVTSADNCLALPALEANASMAWPYASLRTAGGAAMDDRSRTQAVGSIRLGLQSPEHSGWRISSRAEVSSVGSAACGTTSWHRFADVLTSYRVGRGGLWLSYRWRADESYLRPALPSGVVAGAWHSVGDVQLDFAVGTRPVNRTRQEYRSKQGFRWDSVYNDTSGLWEPVQLQSTIIDTVDATGGTVLDARAGISWARGRLSASGTLGTFLSPRGAHPDFWGLLEGALELAPGLALTGGFTAAPAGQWSAFPGRRVATVGLRVSGAAAVDRAPPGGAVPVAFEVRSLPGTRVVLALRAPHTRLVEITGDFNAWSAQPMRPRPDGWWELPLQLAPGRYHVNVRVDGARWIAPPGLPTVRDEFGGNAGVLVLPAA